MPRGVRIFHCVGAMFADRQDPQVAIAVVDELVRSLGSFGFGEEVTRADPMGAVAHHQDSGSLEDEEALFLLMVPVEAGRALAGADDVDVDADPAQPSVLPESRREPEGLAARLVLGLAGRRFFGSDEEGGPFIGATAEALGRQAVNLGRGPLTGGQATGLHPARGHRIVGDRRADGDPFTLVVDEEERVDVTGDAAQLVTGGVRVRPPPRMALDERDEAIGTIRHGRVS